MSLSQIENTLATLSKARQKIRSPDTLISLTINILNYLKCYINDKIKIFLKLEIELSILVYI